MLLRPLGQIQISPKYIKCHVMPSVLWRCWLGGRKHIQPVKNWVVGCWHGYLSGARCRLPYGPAGFTFLVPAHPGTPGKRAIKRVYVCMSFYLKNCNENVLPTGTDEEEKRFVSAMATNHALHRGLDPQQGILGGHVTDMYDMSHLRTCWMLPIAFNRGDMT